MTALSKTPMRVESADHVKIELSDVMDVDPPYSTSALFQASSSSYSLSEAPLRSLDPPTAETESRLIGMRSPSLRSILTPRGSIEQEETRPVLDPEKPETTFRHADSHIREG